MAKPKEKLNKTEEHKKNPGTKRETKTEGSEFVGDPKNDTHSAGKDVDFDKIKGNK